MDKRYLIWSRLINKLCSALWPVTRLALLLMLLLTLLPTLMLGGCASSYEEPDARTFGEFTDDVALLSKVKAALIADKQIGGFRINVDVYRRIVTLKGKVANTEQRAKAEKIAEETKGVASVDNQLVVPAPG